MNDTIRIQQRIRNRKPVLKDTVYSICEMADTLNISVEIARTIVKSNKIKYKIVGSGRGQYRILGEWIMEYLNQNYPI